MKQLIIILSLFGLLLQTVVPNLVEQQELTAVMDSFETAECSKEEKFRDKINPAALLNTIIISNSIAFPKLASRLLSHPEIAKPTPPPDQKPLL